MGATTKVGIPTCDRPFISYREFSADGNSFAIMAKVQRLLRSSGYGDKIDEYLEHATSGDYDNLLRVSLQYVNIGDKEEEEEEEEDECDAHADDCDGDCPECDYM